MPDNIDITMDIVRAFKREASIRVAFEGMLICVIADIVTKIGTFSLTSRTKTEQSFLDKTKREGKNYSDPISEITDLTGIRVVVKYKDEAERVERILREYLTIDEENSRNTREEAEEYEFGYSAIHLIAIITEGIAEQYNIHALINHKFEIQIRTELENAWATKSRELLYNKNAPKQYKRELNRLAALLEIADESFLALRDKVINAPVQVSAHTEEPVSITIADVIDIITGSKAIFAITEKLNGLNLSVTNSARVNFCTDIVKILIRQGAISKETAEEILLKNAEEIAMACKLYMDELKRNSYAKDSLFVAAFALVNNGTVSPAEHCSSWTADYQTAFLAAAQKYTEWQGARVVR